MDNLERLLELLKDPAALSNASETIRCRWISQSDAESLERLLSALAEIELGSMNRDQLTIFTQVCDQIVHAVNNIGGPKTGPGLITKLKDVYEKLGSESEIRSHLLRAMVAVGTSEAFAEFKQQLISNPPKDGRATDQALASLVTHPQLGKLGLFPDLFDAMGQPGLSTGIIDLANFAFRSGKLRPHPGVPRAKALAELLGQVVQRLGKFESPNPDPETKKDDQPNRSEAIADGVGLAVSLCDCLGLIGDKEHIGKLYQASEIAHRRVKIEAAAALARLEEEAGRKMLVDAAADPATRFRAIHYAKELELDERIPTEFKTDQALAEAELAAWLAEPQQFGLAPHSIELFDERTLTWPSFSEPVECRLFRFTYDFGGASYSNVGIVGPLTHAFLVDLNDMPPKELYAAFAGWQVEHPDVLQTSPEDKDPMAEADRKKLVSYAESVGFQEIELDFVGLFFGERMLAGTARYGERTGAIAFSMLEYVWYPTENLERPINSEIAYAILKGRRFLRSFNPEEFETPGNPDNQVDFGSS